MGKPRITLPVKLVCGLLGGDPDLLRRARQLLIRRYGATDHESELIPFTFTDYYRAEMGENLHRLFLSFERLIQPAALAEIKLETNALEQEFADAGVDPEIARPVNLDPGYLDLGKLVLATTKDRSHRIFIGSRIFAEVTLHRVNDAWHTWPWTYPDYATPEYHAFFEVARTKLHEARRRLESIDGESAAPCPSPG